MLFQVAIINARCIYNELADGPKLSVLQVQEHLVQHFLGPAALTPESNQPKRPSISCSSPRSSIASSSHSGHSLQEIPRNANNKLVRKRCTGCYVKLKNEELLARKAKLSAKGVKKHSVWNVIMRNMLDFIIFSCNKILTLQY